MKSEPAPPSGVRYMLLSALGFSLMALFVKLLRRLPTAEVVLARTVIGLVLTYAMLRRAGVSPWGTKRRLLVLRGVLGFGGLFCFFFAVQHLPLAEATVIQYMNPVLTAFLAALLLGERLRPIVVGSALACLLGVVFVQRPAFLFGGGDAALPAFPVAVAVSGAFFSSCAYVTVRRLGRTEDPLVIVFYFPLVALPATLACFALPVAAPDPVLPRGVEWLWLLGVGVFTQVGQVFLTKGLQREPAGRAMTIAYVQILFATLLGLAVFGERPTWSAAVGALLILGGTFSVARSRDPG